MVFTGTNLVYREFTSKSAWQAAIDAYLIQVLQYLLHANPSIRILLSGGSTPQETYQHLSSSSLPFERMALFQADERYVPLSDTDLNATMLRRTLMSAGQQYQSINFFDTSLLQEEAALQYEQLLQTFPKPLFHLAILGVGPDGHTASLFPHSPALHATSLVALSTTSTFASKDRLTLTPSALMQTEQILILASGPEKKPILDHFRTNTGTIDTLPLLCIRNHPSVAVMYSEV